MKYVLDYLMNAEILFILTYYILCINMLMASSTEILTAVLSAFGAQRGQLGKQWIYYAHTERHLLNRPSAAAPRVRTSLDTVVRRWKRAQSG